VRPWPVRPNCPFPGGARPAEGEWRGGDAIICVATAGPASRQALQPAPPPCSRYAASNQPPVCSSVSCCELSRRARDAPAETRSVGPRGIVDRPAGAWWIPTTTSSERQTACSQVSAPAGSALRLGLELIDDVKLGELHGDFRGLVLRRRRRRRWSMTVVVFVGRFDAAMLAPRYRRSIGRSPRPSGRPASEVSPAGGRNPPPVHPYGPARRSPRFDRPPKQSRRLLERRV